MYRASFLTTAWLLLSAGMLDTQAIQIVSESDSDGDRKLIEDIIEEDLSLSEEDENKLLETILFGNKTELTDKSSAVGQKRSDFVGSLVASGPARIAIATQVTSSSSSELEDPFCEAAKEGGDCHHILVHHMTVGILRHPDRYPSLTKHSSAVEFQKLLHKDPRFESVCPDPCAYAAARKLAAERKAMRKTEKAALGKPALEKKVAEKLATGVISLERAAVENDPFSAARKLAAERKAARRAERAALEKHALDHKDANTI